MGTDPAKLRIITMQPPVKDKLMSRNILPKELEEGVYSGSLSEDPRMLMYGVVKYVHVVAFNLDRCLQLLLIVWNFMFA
jgi:hypothetical protein